MAKKHTNINSYSKIVFAAMSKRNFFLREHIIKFVLHKGFTPTCAFTEVTAEKALTEFYT